MTSMKVLECEPICQDRPPEEKFYRKTVRNNYDVEACVSVVLLHPVESTSGSKDAMKHQSSVSALVSSPTWVKFGRMYFTLPDRDEIAGGFQLNDKRHNYAQTILKCKVSIKGLQSTLLQATSSPKSMSCKLSMSGVIIG